MDDFRRQRPDMTVRSILVAGRTKGIIFTLSGELGLHTDPVGPYDTQNAIRVGADGKVYEGDARDGDALSFAQVDAANDWLRPIFNQTQYYVRYSNVVGTFTTSPGAVDTAIALTSNRTWTIRSTIFGIFEVTFDLEILDTNQTTVLAGPSAYRVRVNNAV